jgi:hypothetical protein
VLSHLVLLWIVVGDPWAFRLSQLAWQRTFQAPWRTLAESVHIVLHGNGRAGDWFLYAINAVDLAVGLFALTLGVRALRRPPLRSLGLYTVAATLFFFSHRGPDVVPVWGMIRWAGMLFPLPFILADWLRGPRTTTMAAVASGIALVLLTAWWTSGRWVG